MNEVTPIVIDSPEPIVVPVTIKDKKYELREAPEGAAAKYQDALLRSMRSQESTDGSKYTVTDRVTETEALLVSLCLFELTENGGFKTVPLTTIQGWVHRVVKPLFETAEKISGLARKETKEEIVKKIKELQVRLKRLDTQENELKNLQSAMMDTSV